MSENSVAGMTSGTFPESEQPLPSAAPPVPAEVLATPHRGLERRPQEPKRVIVIGAGAAGLVAAFELLRQGHEPIVLEAQQRVGGRIYTFRDDFAPELYAEAGAMRIPRVHNLTIEYCRLFGLKLRPFLMDSPNAFVHFGGQRLTHAEAARNPERLPFDLAETERGKTWLQLWEDATREITSQYDSGGEAWGEIVAKYDAYSLREFLEERGFSEAAIEMYGLFSFREQNMNTAVVEQFFEIIGHAFEDMQAVVGGTDLLTNAFYQRISEHVRFGAEVTALNQSADSVTVHYRNRAGRFSVNGDYAICTLPLPVLSNIEVQPALSRHKRQAIRELRYNASTKILFQVRRRFWEQAGYGIVGGATVTDLPIRRIVYPSYSDPDNPRGVLLASYTWGQDALRWGSLSRSDRIEQALEDVAKIHPEIREEFEVGASHAWFSDPYAGGAFAQFEPGQATRLQPHIVKPEGRIHFAGEHCSLYHAWIQGALESGIRAAREIHEAPAAERVSASPALAG